MAHDARHADVAFGHLCSLRRRAAGVGGVFQPQKRSCGAVAGAAAAAGTRRRSLWRWRRQHGCATAAAVAARSQRRQRSTASLAAATQAAARRCEWARAAAGFRRCRLGQDPR